MSSYSENENDESQHSHTIRDLNEHVRSLEEDIDTLRKRARSLEVRDAKFQADIEGRLQSFEEQVRSLEEYVDGRLQSFEKQVRSLVVSNAILQDDIEGRLQSFEEQVRSLEEGKDTLRVDVERRLKSVEGDVEGRLKSVEGDVERRLKLFEENSKLIANLSNSVSGLNLRKDELLFLRYISGFLAATAIGVIVFITSRLLTGDIG